MACGPGRSSEGDFAFSGACMGSEHIVDGPVVRDTAPSYSPVAVQCLARNSESPHNVWGRLEVDIYEVNFIHEQGEKP